MSADGRTSMKAPESLRGSAVTWEVASQLDSAYLPSSVSLDADFSHQSRGSLPFAWLLEPSQFLLLVLSDNDVQGKL